jgi:hypothetical protein
MTYIVEKDGERIAVESLEGYEGYAIVAQHEGELPEYHNVENGQIVEDMVAAEDAALKHIDRQAEQVTLEQVEDYRRQIAISILWQELQRLKIANAANMVPGDIEERRKQYPCLEALVFESGATLQQVAVAVEARLWDRVRNMALIEARLLLAHDAVREADTAQAKLDVARNVNWSE